MTSLRLHYKYIKKLFFLTKGKGKSYDFYINSRLSLNDIDLYRKYLRDRLNNINMRLLSYNSSDEKLKDEFEVINLILKLLSKAPKWYYLEYKDKSKYTVNVNSLIFVNELIQNATIFKINGRKLIKYIIVDLSIILSKDKDLVLKSFNASFKNSCKKEALN